MVRSVRPEDIVFLTEIYNYYILETEVSFEEEPLTAKQMQSRIDKVVKNGFPWLVAEENDAVIGYCYAVPWNQREAYRFSAEISAYLLHGYEGRGWGSRLYQTLFSQLKEKGIRTVIGGICLPNSSSVALHEKMGMKKVAHFEKVGYKFGQWLDVGYWQGELT